MDAADISNAIGCSAQDVVPLSPTPTPPGRGYPAFRSAQGFPLDKCGYKLGCL